MSYSALEWIARRLAEGEQPRSRRQMLIGSHAPTELPAAEVPTIQIPKTESTTHAIDQPPASAADRSVMRTAFSRVAPSRDDALTLVETLRDPASNGTFNTRADKAIRSLRSDLADAHRTVSAIGTHSGLRADVLDFFAHVDAIFATLEKVGQSTDSTRAAHLRTTAHALLRRVQTLEQRIGPELAKRKGGH
jgi:hypothetical protein